MIFARNDKKNIYPGNIFLTERKKNSAIFDYQKQKEQQK